MDFTLWLSCGLLVLVVGIIAWAMFIRQSARDWPTERARDPARKEFYDRLYEAADKMPKHDITAPK